MTEWNRVMGSQADKPEEFDTTSSQVTVYQRANIEKVEIEGIDGTKTEMWQYDERQMTPSEYRLFIGLNDSIIAAEQNITDIDLQSIESEQRITDAELMDIETQQQMTDMDLRITVLEEAKNNE